MMAGELSRKKAPFPDSFCPFQTRKKRWMNVAQRSFEECLRGALHQLLTGLLFQEKKWKFLSGSRLEKALFFNNSLVKEVSYLRLLA